jgi:hypothetical protein
MMGNLVFFHPDGTAEILPANKSPEVPEPITIYCDLCNEPLAITPASDDGVYLRCMKCATVNGKPTPPQ